MSIAHAPCIFLCVHEFTPVPALLGGVLIGLASVWLLVANGRIAGVSGILHGVFAAPPGDVLWRLAFIVGLVFAGAAWQLIAQPPAPRPGFSLAWIAVAGLLTGFGTRMGGGCTSGHGVCGLGRLSVRSLVAVALFILTGMATTFVTRHLLGLQS
jgi:uncharacterized membrane protein YedE/YeeE